MGPGSWTRAMSSYLQLMGNNKTYTEFTETKNGHIIPGKTRGPDGSAIFKIYGPHWAPTQRLTEYSSVMIVSSGIGVTPLCASLQSIMHYRWKFSIGKSYPDNASFWWVCSWKEIDLFRWFLRIIKEAEDEHANLFVNNAEHMKGKSFEMHIFVTSLPEPEKRPPIDRRSLSEAKTDEEDTMFWGTKRKNEHNLQLKKSVVTEQALYIALKDPQEEHHVLGNIHIHTGRPKWDGHFKEMKERNKEGDVGVLFCGNPKMAKDLQDNCKNFSSVETGRFFRLHKENF